MPSGIVCVLSVVQCIFHPCANQRQRFDTMQRSHSCKHSSDRAFKLLDESDYLIV